MSNKVKPFIKWAGGKRRIVDTLLANVPKDFNVYYEHFVGGGALFFALNPTAAVLSDINSDLITTYKVIQKNPHLLIDKLKEHGNKHSEDYYYATRKNQIADDDIELAARFIYLNKTCYNGLYRVNNKGEFNVPFGKYKNPSIINEDIILSCSNNLQNVELFNSNFASLNQQPSQNDFVYLDPPYHPIKDNSFTKYAKDDFKKEDQLTLFNYCKELDSKGVKFMASNSDTSFINDLYKGFDIQKIIVTHMMNRSKNIGEVLIKNY